MLTFAQFKTAVRARVFPSGEARSLRASHDKSILDCLIDVQRWVECLQNNNTHLVPHCATYYKCGITSFDFPRALIHKLSVVDRFDENGEEDANADIEWCSEIEYRQVDACHIQSYIGRVTSCTTCWPISQYFAIPSELCGGKSVPPEATDEGLASNLAALQLGYHYAQGSTDAEKRAQGGVWAIEGGRIYVAPWIQSTETVVLRWTGIKREWVDADLIEDDPELLRAAENYLRWEHYRDWERNPQQSSMGELAYRDALSKLIYDCREETRARMCEPIYARGMAPTSQLYFNDTQKATVSCPANQTGDSVTVTIPKDTVASTISVADANQKALELARSQAQDQLDCEDVPTVYWNTPQSYTADCGTGEGSPVTITIQAGQYSSTVSQVDANTQAINAAQDLAEAQLDCTWWNTEQEYTAECPDGTTGADVTATIAAHQHSSDISQDDADKKAYDAAKLQAESDLVCDGNPAVYLNTQVVVTVFKLCTYRRSTLEGFKTCNISITVTVYAGTFSSVISQNDVQALATTNATNWGNTVANNVCSRLNAGQVLCTGGTYSNSVVYGSMI